MPALTRALSVVALTLVGGAAAAQAPTDTELLAGYCLGSIRQLLQTAQSTCQIASGRQSELERLTATRFADEQQRGAFQADMFANQAVLSMCQQDIRDHGSKHQRVLDYLTAKGFLGERGAGPIVTAMDRGIADMKALQGIRMHCGPQCISQKSVETCLVACIKEGDRGGLARRLDRCADPSTFLPF